ncbi:MAG: hypothetical protein A3C90_00940 [Candidatus Magasanikbacteria bacterium RIFCSPHIGHO2_02_FULL_51_14]|uniref:Baseplate protein J-like domain-containing protein n=1 Tax=Candidatus Magasanikbacteria bacterium RIFCSPHIGHO2_02_FULL_51_14 TaxID=1798683 RepID=A0A1F6MQ70_9BACT|nr:MAG: hypothetical protein A3C90_00940 [Candidatus Magasanikbacteria bacterium RIFCSPHIGHO2_02_FULL_51_14]
MVPYRKETKMPQNQPVRFYKIIALSFLVLTLVLLGLIVFMSAKRATITITAKETPVSVTIPVTIGGAAGGDRLAGSVATTSVRVSQTFSPTGTEEVPGVAIGTITVHNESDTDQALVATTRFLSDGGILFRLKNGVRAPARGAVDAEVYADQEGALGNIVPSRFTIPGLNDARQKAVYGTSAASMSGGVKTAGVLSAKDIEDARAKLLEEARIEGEKLLKSVQGELAGVWSVLDSRIETDAEVGDKITGFTMTMTATALGVFYSAEELQELAGRSLEKRAVEESEIIVPSSAMPSVAFDSYDATAGEAVVSVFYDGLASLNPESKEIDKAVLFGKTREEVRRYLLSLDHVQSVEIDFTPAWMRTVPQVKEHVNVVIKSVR